MNTMRIGGLEGRLRALSGCPGLALSVQQVYNLARDAGFAPEAARTMVAIAQRESGLNPSCMATSVAGSTEASYGLWQINMSGTLGTSRLLQFGISSPSQLLDPVTNANAAYSLSGGSNFSPWHIDSDTATVAGQVVNLGYRTKYLNFLAALPGDLESNYAPGAVDVTDDTTFTDVPNVDPSAGDNSSGLWIAGGLLLAGLIFASKD